MTYTIDLDHDGTTRVVVPDGGSLTDFTIAKGDTGPPLEATLEDASGDPLDLSDAYSVRFKMWPHGHQLSDATATTDREATIVDATTGHVRYEWRAADTDRSGARHAAFTVNTSGEKRTIPNTDPLLVIVR